MEREAMLMIYKMTCMEDRELFRVLKEENTEEKGRLWYNPITHTQLDHYKQPRAWEKKVKASINEQRNLITVEKRLEAN